MSTRWPLRRPPAMTGAQIKSLMGAEEEKIHECVQYTMQTADCESHSQHIAHMFLQDNPLGRM